MQQFISDISQVRKFFKDKRLPKYVPIPFYPLCNFLADPLLPKIVTSLIKDPVYYFNNLAECCLVYKERYFKTVGLNSGLKKQYMFEITEKFQHVQQVLFPNSSQIC